MAVKRARVLLADDHTIVAQGLASLLKDTFELVGIVANGQELVDAAGRLRADVIIADMSMPVMSGLDALRRMRAEGVSSKVVFLTMHRDPALAAQALRAGASGYLLKQSAGEDLVEAIKDVLAGRVFLGKEISAEVVAALASGDADGGALPANRLTVRQHDVLRLVVQGKTMKEVAAALNLSRRTVETYKYEMMQTLGVQTSGELIQFAFRNGLAVA